MCFILCGECFQPVTTNSNDLAEVFSSHLIGTCTLFRFCRNMSSMNWSAVASIQEMTFIQCQGYQFALIKIANTVAECRNWKQESAKNYQLKPQSLYFSIHETHTQILRQLQSCDHVLQRRWYRKTKTKYHTPKKSNVLFSWILSLLQWSHSIASIRGHILHTESLFLC